jgi:hypothetical protein
VLYGLTAVLTKTTTSLLGQGALTVFDHWQPYVLAAASGIALVLNQSAFQAGHLAASLPAISVVNPVIAALLGAALFGERLGASGGLALTMTTASAVLMAAATIFLARSPVVTERSAPPDHERGERVESEPMHPLGELHLAPGEPVERCARLHGRTGSEEPRANPR